MSLLRPFRALRPLPDQACEVSAVPYDVVNRNEAAELAKGKSLSFLHVSRAEIDLEPQANPYGSEVYERAKANFSALKKMAPLIQDQTPCLYVYRLKQGNHSQTGIAATFSIDEYDQEQIKKHERTRQDKEDDRTRHLLTIEAQTGPVFLAYRAHSEIDREIAMITESAPLFHFETQDGVTHQIWKVEKTETLCQLFKKIPALYIADGHHRAASASRARAELRKKNPRHQGNEPYNFFLAVAFPENQLRILPYHRLVKDLYGKSETEFLKTLEAEFKVTANAAPTPQRGEFSMYLGKKWYGLKPLRAISQSSPIESLDVTVLQDRLLKPILGIENPRTDSRIDFVGGIRGTAELEKKVNSGQAAVAFAMHPTSLQDLFRISDAGEIMPPKSTWFEPKLRDGLLSHSFS